MSDKQQAISIFGQRPENCIYLPDVPFSVRLNCKDGGIFIGGNEPKHRKTNPEDTIEISILKASKFYGNLGKTEGALWVQLFFIPAPSVTPEILPPNTVCVSYIKKQSIAHLYNTVQAAMNKCDPGFGIFTLCFNRQNGELGTYYTIDFEWRERNNDAEHQQLEQIKTFLGEFGNQLIDIEGTRAMTCVNGMTAAQLQAVMMSAVIEEERIQELTNGKKQRRLKAAS